MSISGCNNPCKRTKHVRVCGEYEKVIRNDTFERVMDIILPGYVVDIHHFNSLPQRQLSRKVHHIHDPTLAIIAAGH